MRAIYDIEKRKRIGEPSGYLTSSPISYGVKVRDRVQLWLHPLDRDTQNGSLDTQKIDQYRRSLATGGGKRLAKRGTPISSSPALGSFTTVYPQPP